MKFEDWIGERVTAWVVLRRRFWRWLSYTPMPIDDLNMIAFFEMMSSTTISTYEFVPCREAPDDYRRGHEIRTPSPTWVSWNRDMKKLGEALQKVAEQAEKGFAEFGQKLSESMGRSASQIRRGWNEDGR
jgi:hypothetical protein